MKKQIKVVFLVSCILSASSFLIYYKYTTKIRSQSQWGSWSECSVSCGTNGSRARERYCPQYDTSCDVSQKKEVKPCLNIEPCDPSNSHWTAWGNWGNCDYDCKDGIQVRTRKCKNPANKDCNDKDKNSASVKQIRNCPNKLICDPIDGKWGGWTNWGECSVTCGKGKRGRYRICDQPPVKFSGKPCVGELNRHSDCELKPCTNGKIKTEKTNETSVIS